MRRKLLILFNALAGVISHELFRNKGDVRLYVDAYNGDMKAVAKLKDLGCDNEMPIYCAAQFGHAEAIIALKNAGADVNTPEKLVGATPVYIAAQNGHAEAIIALKNAGADVNTPAKLVGATPVYVAAQNGHAVAVATLLDAGADASIERRTRPKTEWWAGTSISVCLDIITAAFLRNTIIEISPWGKNTPLKVARQGTGAGHQEVVKLLEMHFQQYPDGIKPLEQRNPLILTQFHHASKHTPEAHSTPATNPDKKVRNSREL